jgi:hypothetical protein
VTYFEDLSDYTYFGPDIVSRDGEYLVTAHAYRPPQPSIDALTTYDPTWIDAVHV